MNRLLSLLVLSGALCVPACFGQAGQDSSWCSAENRHNDNRITVADSREQRLPSAAVNSINPGMNGSVKVHGWQNADVLVKACVYASAPTDSEARALASQVSITRGAGSIEPTGPSAGENSYWGVSYQVWVPNASNLHITAQNGSIAVDNVRGELRFHTMNGSVKLSEVGGNVEGSTTNGSVAIEIAPGGFAGSGLKAETTNGSVHLVLPENISAQVQASTVNGKISVDFPITVQGDIGKNMNFQLGAGGPLIEAKTVNGSVKIAKRS